MTKDEPGTLLIFERFRDGKSLCDIAIEFGISQYWVEEKLRFWLSVKESQIDQLTERLMEIEE